jgi:predicted phage terminase large subunit-like protein
MRELSVSPEEAAAEILRRRRARDSLVHFAQYTKSNYVADPFHCLLAKELEQVSTGETDRLMIFTPPRHGKTQLSSISFPAWFMARNPETNVIGASYNAEQATRSSRFTRDIIRSTEYAQLFPHAVMSPESRAADRWMLDNGQEYFAVGVGSGATGKGGHLILIDDPFKDREEADSPSRRQLVWDWYMDVIYTRLERGGRVILIQTRWHHDDLGGRLLRAQEKGGDQWKVLKLPAICEDKDDPLGREIGEPLAPGRRTLKELERIRANVPDRTWSALYQQRPMNLSGGMFKPAWFENNFIEPSMVPAKRTKVRAWDFGSTLKGDPTVGALMSKDKDGVFYIEAIERGKLTPLQVQSLVTETAESDGRNTRITIPKDPGQAGVAQSEAFIRSLAGYNIKAVRPTGSKEVRASAFAAQCEARNVKIVGSSSERWVEDLLAELATFPLGQHDDQVDALSDAFAALLGSKKAHVIDW